MRPIRRAVYACANYGMKRKLLIVLSLYAGMAFAARPQKREVVIDTLCHAPIERMIQVADSFCYQFQACPDSLFLWAYLNMDDPEVKKKAKRTKDSRTVIELRYKDRAYNAQTKTGDVALDIYVLGMRWWKDQHLGTVYAQTHPAHLPYPVTAHMTATYSGSILEGGNFIMVMEPLSPTKTLLHYEFNITFGQTLSAFISNKTWHNSMEWRFRTILENLVECAETGTVQRKQRGVNP